VRWHAQHDTALDPLCEKPQQSKAPPLSAHSKICGLLLKLEQRAKALAK
jgi:hypothetical protein